MKLAEPTPAQARVLAELDEQPAGMGIQSNVYAWGTLEAMLKRGLIKQLPIRIRIAAKRHSRDYVAAITEKGRAALAKAGK